MGKLMGFFRLQKERGEEKEKIFFGGEELEKLEYNNIIIYFLLKDLILYS